ncbi:MAG TPA: NAD(P)H-dependent glycerol-3-phosphate dehydrogenase [Dehalococcoidia bacterium]|nr:NAD(P)H-dependent glycerol-3-phosphate dehydrogenase [Dehalococcoidia bacterium]
MDANIVRLVGELARILRYRIVGHGHLYTRRDLGQHRPASKLQARAARSACECVWTGDDCLHDCHLFQSPGAKDTRCRGVVRWPPGSTEHHRVATAGAEKPGRIAIFLVNDHYGGCAPTKPSSTVIASTDEATATYAQTFLNSSNLRVYTNKDVIGVELAGALKNIVAIAAGISDGLGFGDNAKASIITRGLAEISRLGVSLGANPATFAGLAGMGDVIATCSSNLSRNNSLGRMLASGMSLDDITDAMENIAEGIGTTQEVVQIAETMNIDIPLTKSVYSVLFDGVAPLDAVAELMGRSPTSEL